MSISWIAILLIGLIFLMETLGVALVFCFKEEIPDRLRSGVMGLAAGVMLAASFWSLLLPSMEESKKMGGKYAVISCVALFLFGGVVILALDVIARNSANKRGKRELFVLPRNARSLFVSMALHNVPEGLALGFTLASAFAGGVPRNVAAIGLAIGVGIQNIPEGAALSLGIKGAGRKKSEAFFYGVISAVFEPVFAIVGYFFAVYLQTIQPWLLAFSAGAVLFVVMNEILPESKNSDPLSIGGICALCGFTLMTLLDVFL